MSFFEKNRAFIAQRFPHLLTELSRSTPEAITVEVEQSKTGLPVARVNAGNRKVYLNSPYDPLLDAERWAANQATTPSGNLLLVGGGFLYHLKALLKQGHHQKIIVYEPSRTIFRAWLNEIDLTALGSENKFLLFVGDDVENHLKLLEGYLGAEFVYSETSLKVTLLPAYKDLFVNEIGQFQTKFIEFIRLTHVNLATNDFLQEKWLENQFHNLKYISDSPVIRHFLGRFKGVPAVIVSAGPSLEKNIHLLNEVKDKALIICAGSSIRAMRRNGVAPHFLLTFDPSEVNAKIYNDLDLSDVYLLFPLRFYHGVVSCFPGKKIMFQTNTENFPNLIEESLGYKFGTIRSGFSCAHPCLDLAYQLGCNPIIFIGQDLAYTGDKRYAEGHNVHQKYLGQTELPSNCFITKDLYGKDIVTDKELDGFRMVFEKMIHNDYQGKVELINATEGGVPIRGAINRKLSEVLHEYCQKDQNISEIIRQVYERGLKELRNQRLNVGLLAEKLYDLISRGIVQMAELIDRLQELRRFNFSGKQSFQELDNVLEQIATSYDQALSYKEYHYLLKELQNTKLSVNKHRTVELSEIENKEQYDQRLQNYLLILLETKKHLEFIGKCIQANFEVGRPKEGQPKMAADQAELILLEAKIKKNEDLNEVLKAIESYLKRSSTPEYGMYLNGLILLKKDQKDRAITAFEESVSRNNSFSKPHFWLAKLYYERKNSAKAVKHLNYCREQNYHSGYCLKMLLKIHYYGKDYAAVNNLLEDYQKMKTSKRLISAIRIEGLCQLDLAEEALKEYHDLSQNRRLPDPLNEWLKSRLNSVQQSEYAKKYRVNTEFLQKYGLVVREYSEVRYKVSRFLSGELIYDSANKKFFPWTDPKKRCDLKIWLDDAVVIHNPDHPNVFERLCLIYQEIESPETRKQFINIPVYVVEQDPEHWNLLLQLFDFQRFKEWQNLHFQIGKTNEELRENFLDESAPLPNIFYGNAPEQFEQFLLEVKQAKDDLYRERIQRLNDYYQTNPTSILQKILLVISKYDEVSFAYGQAIQNFLSEKGYDCRLHTESNLYCQMTGYQNAKILDEFRPNLVIGLGFIKEELEAFREIPVPVKSWLISDKSLDNLAGVSGLQEQVYLSGNLKVREEMLKQGFPADQIHSIGLPILKDNHALEVIVDPETDLGIITDLADSEAVLKNMEIVIQGMLSGQKISPSEIGLLVKTIYFSLYTRKDGDSLSESDAYEKVVSDVFAQNKLAVEPALLQFIAALFKRELEKTFLKLWQAWWVADNIKEYTLSIYGSGWEHNEALRRFYKGSAGLIQEFPQYRRLVLQNKINLYLGPYLNNHSYIQPDLLAGIAAGGFFLVNDLLFREIGPEVGVPFDGLLETYGDRMELSQKIHYYLEHDQERRQKAELLQNFVRQNFSIAKVMGELL